MRHVRRGVGVVIGLLVSGAPLVSASIMPVPEESMPWVIESAEYTGAVQNQIARMEARYTIRLLRDGWVEVPMAIQGATITAIEVTKKTGDAHIAPRGQSYVLVATRKGAYKVHVNYSTMVVQDSQFEGMRLGIPQATFSTVSLFVPRQDVELRPEDQLYVERKPDGPRGGVMLVARLGASDHVDLRWRTKPATPVTIEPLLYGEVNTLVTIEEQLARLTSIIDYRIAQGETKELSIQLPSGLNVLNVRGAGIEDWHVTETPDHKTLRVALNFLLKETTYRLVVEGEHTIGESVTEYSLPEIQLTGVKQERGYLAVARSGNIELSPQTTDGINRVDVKELPEVLQAAMSGSAMLAFKYHQHPYKVALALTRHQDHAVLAAIAERAELATVLSRQGELLTRATYLIKANKKQYLSVLLPEGATLWSCIVDSKSVKPVEGTKHELLVPLDAMSQTAETVSVELVYFERRPELIRIGHLNLQGPILDVPTTIANWSVYAPREVKFLRMSGNLERGITPLEFLEEPFVQTAYAQTLGSSGMSFNGRGDKDVTLGLKKRILRSKEVQEQAARNSAIDELGDLSSDTERVQQRDNRFGEGSPKSTIMRAVTAPAAAPERGRSFEEIVGGLAGRLEETGILPLKIHLPKSGSVYHFSRLITTQDALTLNVTFVHVPLSWMVVGAFGLLLCSAGGWVGVRSRRA